MKSHRDQNFGDDNSQRNTGLGYRRIMSQLSLIELRVRYFRHIYFHRNFLAHSINPSAKTLIYAAVNS